MFVLIQSPLVGPFTWRPVARALEARGERTVVPELGRATPPFWTRYAERIAHAVDVVEPRDALVLVAHSAAGLLLPAVRAAIPDHSVERYLLVDASLPRSGARLVDTIPASAGVTPELLREQATHGMLPAWGQDWPDALWEQLVPDPESRSRFRRELEPVPLAL